MSIPSSTGQKQWTTVLEISKMYSIDRASSLIGSVLDKHGLRDHAEAALLTYRIEQWLQSQAPALAPCICVEPVRSGVVTLSCRHAIALSECQILLPSIQAFIQGQKGWMTHVRVRAARSAKERVASRTKAA